MEPARRAGGSPTHVLDAMLRDWTKRIGPEAAAHRVAYYRVIAAAWSVGLAGLALMLVGSAAHVRPLGPVGGVVLLGGLMLYVRAAMELRRMNERAGEALGVAIRFFGGPPSRPALYRRWCERHHLAPYPFPDAVPPVVKTRWF